MTDPEEFAEREASNNGDGGWELDMEHCSVRLAACRLARAVGWRWLVTQLAEALRHTDQPDTATAALFMAAGARSSPFGGGG